MATLPKLRNDLKTLLESLPLSRPLLKPDLDSIISNYLTNDILSKKFAVWDTLFREQVFSICMGEGAALKDPQTTYYQDLADRLDVILTFSEMKACDPQLPLAIVEDLFETQTVASCVHIFSWLELRCDRIIVDMHPNKGKGLTLLRTLNDLLRRISKTGNATKFCGRILIFLSSVFPFGERSGVNLRGEYGPSWVPVTLPPPTPTQGETQVKEGDPAAMEGVESTAPKTVNVKSEEEKKVEFYNTFWGLQTFFARPQALTVTGALENFKNSVVLVLGALVEATKKEQAMMGSGHRSGGVGTGVLSTTVSEGAVKRKREGGTEGSQATETVAAQEYFFAKFLTSPDLLLFELSDTFFRRQIVIQLLILLRHLLSFTAKEKLVWVTPRNRTLQMDLTITEGDEKWLRDLWAKAILELRNTTPDGRSFASTVSVILDRDRNWVRWKNELCPPIGKIAKVTETDGEADEKAKSDWRKVFGPYMREEDDDRPVPYGSMDLSEVWTMGYREIEDLENPSDLGDAKGFQKQIKLLDMQQEGLRKRKGLPAVSKHLSVAQLPPPRPSTPGLAPPTVDGGLASGAASPSRPTGGGQTAGNGRNGVEVVPTEILPMESDEQLEEFNMKKQSLTWRALRLAIRQGHLLHFPKIGTGDVDLLVQEINRPPRARPAASTPIQPVIQTPMDTTAPAGAFLDSSLVATDVPMVVD